MSNPQKIEKEIETLLKLGLRNGINQINKKNK